MLVVLLTGLVVALLAVPSNSVVAEWLTYFEKAESSLLTDDILGDGYMSAMSFNTTESHTVAEVEFKMDKREEDADKPVYWEIRDDDAGGYTDNYSGTVMYHGEVDTEAMTWYDSDHSDAAWEVSTAVEDAGVLSANHTYTLVVEIPSSSSADDWVYWLHTDEAVEMVKTTINDGANWSDGGLFAYAYRIAGLTSVAPATIETGSAYSTVVNGVLSATFIADLVDNADNTTAFRGFEIGTSSENYELPLRILQMAAGGNATDEQLFEDYGYVWRGEEGEFSIVSRSLSANTTYYYRAFADTIDESGNIGYAKGEEKSFSTVPYTGVLFPIVELDGVIIWRGVISGSVNVISSASAPLASVWIQYGTNYSSSPSTENITWLGARGEVTNNVGLYLLDIIYDVNDNIREGWSVFVRAYAIDSLYNVGYSDIVRTVKPYADVGSGGLTVTIIGADVLGNIAEVSALVNNPANVPVVAYIVSWGQTSDADDQMVQLQLASNPTTLTYTITALESSTVYFYKFAVFGDGEWIWPQASAFTTGTIIDYPLQGMPSVATKAATNIGVNHFRANGSLSSLGEADVTQLGFAWSHTNTNDVKNWNFSLTSGNFSIGLFNQDLTFSEANNKVYYVAVARNIYGTSYGSVFYANMGTSTGDNVTGGTGTVAQPVQELLNWLEQYGLNNAIGKWGIVLALMIILFIFFKESSLLRVAAPMLAFGLGLISGLLEWWIVLLLAIVAAGVALMISSKTQGGG